MLQNNSYMANSSEEPQFGGNNSRIMNNADYQVVCKTPNSYTK